MMIEISAPEARTLLHYLRLGRIHARSVIVSDMADPQVKSNLTSAMRKLDDIVIADTASKAASDKEQLANDVLRLLHNVPNGQVVDADTILADYMADADFQVSGITDDLIAIWRESNDKDAVEAVFELFTEYTFQKWLETAVEKTTRDTGEER